MFANIQQLHVLCKFHSAILYVVLSGQKKTLIKICSVVSYKTLFLIHPHKAFAVFRRKQIVQTMDERSDIIFFFFFFDETKKVP